MKCPKCGAENNDGAKFCKSCGGDLQNNSSSDNSVSQSKGNNNTLIICVTILLAIIVIAGAFVLLNNGSDDSSGSNDVVSDDDSSVSEDADGGDVSIENDQLSIQGFDFTIPEGFVENESAQRVAEDGKDGFEGFKISNVEFNKGEEFIVIKVVFGDVDIDEESYTPADDTVPKEVAGVNGWFTEYSDSVSFDYIADGKIVEIFAPNEEMLADLIESSQA